LIVPVGDEAAEADPAAFHAVTTTRSRFPASRLCKR
jgi:hypothetical protein